MEDFIPFKEAQKLKEKRFNGACMYYYTCDGELKNVVTTESAKKDAVCTAPQIHQVLKWLREKEKIHVQIEMCGKCYKCSLYEEKLFDSYLVCSLNDGYKSYEDAAISGIEYVIDKLI